MKLFPSTPAFYGEIKPLYSEELDFYENQYILEIRGFQNGKKIDLHFNMINDKWMLVKWNDYSK